MQSECTQVTLSHINIWSLKKNAIRARFGASRAGQLTSLGVLSQNEKFKALILHPEVFAVPQVTFMF